MVMSLYPTTQKNPKLAANVVKMLDMGMGNELAEEFRPSTGQAMNIHRQTAQKINPSTSKFVWKRPNQIGGSYTENELKSLNFRYSAKYNMWGGTQQMWDRLSGKINEFAPPSSDRGEGGFGPFKVHLGNHFINEFPTFEEAREEIRFLCDADPSSANDDWKIIDGTGKKVWQHDPGAAYDEHRMRHKIRFNKPGDLKEFAPPGSDDREPDEEEILRQLAAQWWNGSEQQMRKAQQTLQAMGWEIGQDESGDDDAGVFVIRIGDENGDSYIAFNHSDLDLNEDYLHEK